MPPSRADLRPSIAFVVSAPSGAGKTTLCRRMIARMGDLAFSTSHTTRPPRPHERNGHDYHFVDPPHFERMVAEEAFVEWARVHGRLYGTSRAEIDRLAGIGCDVLFEIDVQGGRQILAALPQVALIFIVPPSMAVLATRLRQRASDASAEIDRRLAVAADEVRQAAFYTHWIVNDDLEEAAAQMHAIIVAERLRFADKALLSERVLAATNP